jgi:hypothetical protein
LAERRVPAWPACPGLTEHTRSGLACIAPTDASALVSALAEDGIVTSERDGNLRVSAHAYNVEEDGGAVLALLERCRVLLR